MRSPVVIFLVGIGILLSSPQWSYAQWAEVGSPKGGWITSIVVSGTDLFASTRKGGVFISTDNGDSWKAVNSGLPKKTDFQCLAVVGKNIFVGSVEHGVFLSKDNGASWVAVNEGLPEGCSVWRFVVSEPNIFAVAGTKSSTVFRSEDNGASWALAMSGLGNTQVLDLAVAGTNLFAGTANGVFLSKDDGASWTAVNEGLPPNILSDVEGAKIAILRIAAMRTNIFAGAYFSGFVFLSKNNGASWIPVNSGLPHSTLLFSLSDLAVRGTDLFLGSYIGVFLSANNGTFWTAINSGLPSGNSIYCLAVSGTQLFAGTEEGKVWRLPFSNVTFASAKLYNQGVGYIKDGRVDDAIAAYKKAVDLKPDFASAWFNLGFCYGKSERTGDAIAAFEQTVKLKPNFANAWFYLGICYRDTGLNDNAIAAFEKAIKFDADNPEAWEQLGDLYAKTGRAKEANAAQKKATKLKKKLNKKTPESDE